MEYWRAIAVRILLAVVTVIAGVFLSAVLVRYAPGFGADERQLDARLNSESIQSIRQQSAKERDVASYFVQVMRRLLHGDLGVSRTLQRPVSDLLAERGAVTLELVGEGLAIAWSLAVLVVLLSWLTQSIAITRACLVGSGMLLCLPAGAMALLLILVNGPACLALALVVYPKVHRYLGGLVESAGRMPHVLAAKSNGISVSRLLACHVLPTIGPEILALAGVSVGLAVGAAIPVEALCGIPGIGQLAWQSALARDLPVLTMVSWVVISCTVLANSGSDLLDDRSRLVA